MVDTERLLKKIDETIEKLKQKNILVKVKMPID